MDTTTSRTAALDFLLCIGNLLALADHKEEEILNLIEERNNLSAVTSDPDELDTLTNNINNEMFEAQRERERLYDYRKQLQRNFFEIYNIDNDYRCQFKHFAVALTAMEECRNAHPTVQNDQLLIRFRQLTYQFLGIIMGVGPANCGRCLADMINEAPIQTPAVEPTSPFKSDNG